MRPTFLVPTVRATWLVGLAVGVAALVPASMASAQAAPATPPTTVPVGAIPASSPTTMPLVDDMRTLTLEVPAAWSDVSTVPGTAGDGSQYPQLIASPNIASFQQAFDTPGVMYVAQPLNTDTAAGLKALFDFTGQCTDGGARPYQDLYFTGTTQSWTNCGGGQASVTTVFANPLDQRFSVALVVSSVQPADDEARSLVLASFFVTKPQGNATGTPATTLPGVTSAVPAVSVPAVTLPTVAIPGPAVTPTTAPTGVTGATGATGDVVVLQDDTQAITVGVPSAWTQVNTSPAADSQGGGQVPAISAAPDLNAFQAGQGVGVFMIAAPATTDLQAAITSMAPQGCQGAAATPYQDDVFSGLTQTFANCGGFTVTVLAANAASNPSATIQILAATTPGDDSPLQVIASTFNFASGAGGSSAG